MKTLFSPTPSFSPQIKSSHAPQARQGVLVTDPPLVRAIYEGIQNHEFPTKELFPPKLIEESQEVSYRIACALGINTDKYQVKTIHVDKSDSFEELCKSIQGMKERGGIARQVYINSLNFLSLKDSKEFIGLQVGKYFQDFSAFQTFYNTDVRFPQISMGPARLSSELQAGNGGFGWQEYLRTIIPLVAEPIKDHPKVIGSILGDYNKEREQTIYKGAGTIRTLNAFLRKNPDLFWNRDPIKRMYGKK
ncbi:MAG: hypothetical protein LW809_02765 [Vampirovibrionales bacterium]|jgi:hypothetical protein|nr:hypothetical protein [Vampirovibrionales bacterium]